MYWTYSSNVASLTFPSTPTNGQLYPSNPVAGQNQYQWNASTNTWTVLGAATGVTFGTYGSPLTIPEITIDASGRITLANNIPIQLGTTSLVGLVQLVNDTANNDSTRALTAAQGYKLQGEIGDVTELNPFAPNLVQAINSAANVTGVNVGTYGNGSAISRFTVNSQGRITSAQNVQLSPASAVSTGVVRIGDNLQVTSSGLLSVPVATSSLAGVTRLVNNTTTNDSTKALTSAQGYALQNQITNLTNLANLTFIGTLNAVTGLMTSVTPTGTLNGYAVGGGLPAAITVNKNFLIVVNVAGNYLPPGGSTAFVSVGDWFISNGAQWVYYNVAAPNATTTVSGIVKLSTTSETQGGISSTVAVTPVSLQSKISNSVSSDSTFTIASSAAAKAAYDAATIYATTFNSGVVELATDTETQGGSATNLSVTPASLQSKVSDSVTTDSSVLIASSKAVKIAYDTAIAASGGGGGGGVNQVNTGTGLTGGPITNIGTVALTNTAVTPGSYTNANITIDAQGRITSASAGTATGVTLVNTGSGLTGGPISNTGTISLTNTAVTPGSYTNANVTIDAQGRVTSASNGVTAGVTKIIAGSNVTVSPVSGTGDVTINALGGGGGGGVTLVNTGTGLTGGPISSTGTIGIAAGGITNTQISSTAAIESTKLSYLAPFTGSVSRTVTQALTNVLNLKDFGAVGDGVTNDTNALFNAVAALNAKGGGTLYVPDGTYRILNTGAQLIFTASFTLTGNGTASSKFKYIDYNSPATRNDFLTVGAASAASIDIVVKDISIEGDWGVDGNYTAQSNLIAFNTTGNILLDSVNLSNSRLFAASLGNYFGNPLCNSVIVNNCRVDNTYGDGISIRGTLQSIVTGCYFRNTNDDSIACHTVNASPSPVQNYAVISNNNFVSAGGVAVLGAKHTVISNNSFTRIAYSAIRIEGPGVSGFPEGDTNIFSINVSDNIIDTVFNANLFSSQSGSGVYYIRIASGATTSTSAGYPNNPDGSGNIISPYPYWYLNSPPTTSAPNTGGYSITVSNNICMRSLGPVSAYTSYGFGPWLSRNGPVDPAITPAALGLDGVYAHYEFKGGLNNFVISNNTSYGSSIPITVDALDTNTTNITNGKIVGNICSNYLTYGLLLNGQGDIVVSDNMFDGDPLHTSQWRSSSKNGTWLASGLNQICAVAVGGKMLVSFLNNSIKNVYSVYVGVNPNEMNAVGNIMYANPVSPGSLSNISIAALNIPVANNRNTLVVWQGNPSAAKYGSVLNVCLVSSSSIPTSGTYLQGWVVSNSNPTIQGSAGSRYTVQGWCRLTNGSAHVSNTDWVEMRSFTGT